MLTLKDPGWTDCIRPDPVVTLFEPALQVNPYKFWALFPAIVLIVETLKGYKEVTVDGLAGSTPVL